MFSFQETGPMATFRSVRNENKISLLWIERKLSLQTFLVFPFLLYIALAKLLSLFPSVIDRPNWISIRDFRAHIGISLAFSISPRSISRFRFFTRASRYPIRVVCIPAERKKSQLSKCETERGLEFGPRNGRRKKSGLPSKPTSFRDYISKAKRD